VRFRLTPQETSFYPMFAQAADNIVAAAKLLDELFSQDVNDALVEKMKDIEHQGDDVTHDIMRRLNLTFVTPFDRRSISSSSTSCASCRPRWPIKSPSCSGWLS
jgi:uncharacterized protein